MSIEEAATRAAQDLAERPWGPMAFRFALQPIVAVALGVRDGIRDGKSNRNWYLLSLILSSENRMENLRDGLHATQKVFVLALLLDAIYQIAFLGAFYPGEALAVAVALSFFPYILVRGPIARVVRRQKGEQPGKDGSGNRR